MPHRVITGTLTLTSFQAFARNQPQTASLAGFLSLILNGIVSFHNRIDQDFACSFSLDTEGFRHADQLVPSHRFQLSPRVFFRGLRLWKLRIDHHVDYRGLIQVGRASYRFSAL